MAVSILSCGTVLTPGQTFSAPLVLIDNKDITRYNKEILDHTIIIMLLTGCDYPMKTQCKRLIQ